MADVKGVLHDDAACCAAVFCLLQDLSDQEKIQHCRAVAERGLSDLMAYCKMSSTADGGNYSINLKGATQ